MASFRILPYFYRRCGQSAPAITGNTSPSLTSPPHSQAIGILLNVGVDAVQRFSQFLDGPQRRGHDIAFINHFLHFLTGVDTHLLADCFKYDNLVLDPETLEIKALLDWEMATVGDPLMDLGTSLGYWAEQGDHPALKSFGLTGHDGNLNRQEIVETYAGASGIKTDNIVFYYVFGCFKIAVIAQQIYARFKQGLTKDPRFAGLIYVTNACAENAAKAIKYNRINNFK